jgi:serine/threonine protein kinase, bacterial
MPLVTGETAAGFTIVRLLGNGQIGDLYLAEHPRLPRQYALKILSADISADPEYRYRFNQESDLAASLWHPNIVGIHDRGEYEGQLWLAMDYVDATDAAQLLIDAYPEGMPPDMVIEIVSVIADALDYAHERGLVHRYVNPSNILVSSSESDRRRFLLAGFGLPRRPDEVNNLYRRGLAIGTASYAAPEQLMDDSIDDRTDQYALACTAFHLLTGSPPFAHMKPAVVTNRQLNAPAPRPGDVRPELTYFDVPFARALMKSPGERFRRCRDFARALEVKEKLGPYTPTAAAAALLTADKTHNGAPVDAPAAPPTVAVPDPPVAGERDNAAPEPLPPNDIVEPAASPTARQKHEVDDATTIAEADSGEARSAAPSEAHSAARRRRLVQSGALGLTIAAVALAGILGVRALRSASQPDQTPTTSDSSSPVPTMSVVPPAPATAIPPPIVKAPPPRTATTTTRSTAPAASTTTPPTHSSTAPQTTAAQTTTTHSTTSTTPTSLDTRPAVGVPCGAPGASATSNSGLPVVCVDTPGGSAWEPPGG